MEKLAQQKLLEEYRAGVERRAREARQAPAPPAPHEARSRFSHTAEPINEKRLAAVDGPSRARVDADVEALIGGDVRPVKQSELAIASRTANERRRQRMERASQRAALRAAERAKVRVAS